MWWPSIQRLVALLVVATEMCIAKSLNESVPYTEAVTSLSITAANETWKTSMSTKSMVFSEKPVPMTNSIFDLLPSTISIDPFNSDIVPTSILVSLADTEDFQAITDNIDDYYTDDVTAISPSHSYITSNSDDDILDLLTPEKFMPTGVFSMTSSDQATFKSYSTIFTNDFISRPKSLDSTENLLLLATPSFSPSIPITTVSPSLFPSSSHLPATTSSAGGGGKGILSNLADAPLWAWVIVAFVVLAFISCCFLMCSLAAYLSRNDDNKRRRRQKQTQAQECRRMSFKMKKMYGELEEGKPSAQERPSQAYDEDDSNSIPFSRWDSFRMSWSRRSSRKTITTFKPNLNQSQDTGSAGRTSPGNIMEYTPAPSSMVVSNANTQVHHNDSNSEMQISSVAPATSNSYVNPMYRRKHVRWPLGDDMEDSELSEPNSPSQNSNPHW